jgi:hypothetical protein
MLIVPLSGGVVGTAVGGTTVGTAGAAGWVGAGTTVGMAVAGLPQAVRAIVPTTIKPSNLKNIFFIFPPEYQDCIIKSIVQVDF